MTRDNLLNKIGKLHAKAESAKELGQLAEAEAFAAKVTQLLADNKLSMTEVEFATMDKEEPIERQVVTGDDIGVGWKQRRTQWQQSLANGIARNNGCRILIMQGSNSIIFVGRKSDRDIAVYLFCSLVPKLVEISKREDADEYYRCRRMGTRKAPHWKRSWLIGAVSGIIGKMDEVRYAAEKQAAMSGQGTALVRISGEDVQKYIDDRFKRKGPGFSASGFSSSGYHQGHAFGKSLSIHDGVGSGTGSRRLNR